MPETFTNPVNPRGDDPFVTKYNGVYYYCYAVGGGVNVTSASELHQIHRNPPSEAVYRAPAGTAYSHEYWAPELHRIDGRWIIYVAADDGDNFHHRMYALGALTDDPCGPYEMLGKVAVAEPYDKWAIDGTVLNFKGVHYFIWSGWAGNVNVQQNLYIARMKDAVTLDSPRFLISEPEFDWETRSCGVDGLPAINEGPIALQRGGRTFVIYSASGSWSDDYCLGMLELVGDDPLDPRAWKKYPDPVFSPCEGAWGAGHCSFTTSPDGNEDYIVYHANTNSKKSWGGRSLRMQKFTWENGLPVFGGPVAPGVEMPIPSNGKKKIDTILFDLDGTLLPMEQDAFVKAYMAAVCRKMAEYGYHKPDDVVNALWKGTYAMVANDGKNTNHDVFWKVFSDLLGQGVLDAYDALCRFYENEFDAVKSVIDPCFGQGNYPVRALIDSLKAKGYRLILSTNPVFPANAVKTRLNWIGLTPDDFAYVSTYENSRFCKPNVRYFEEILFKAGGDPDHCLTVGNSVSEDLAAANYGMDCYLITDFIENPKNLDYSAHKHGSFADFVKYAEENL